MLLLIFLLYCNSDLFPRPRYSAFGSLETKFAICLDDNGILVDIFANNNTDGKISKRNIYGHLQRPSKDGRKWKKEKLCTISCIPFMSSSLSIPFSILSVFILSCLRSGIVCQKHNRLFQWRTSSTVRQMQFLKLYIRNKHLWTCSPAAF